MIIVQSVTTPAADPLSDAIQESFAPEELELSRQPLHDVEWSLLEMVCDAAVISPAGYGQSVPDIHILDGACVAAYGAVNDITLYFKEGLHHLSTVACIGVSPADTMLATIVLREKYHMTPVFSQIKGTIDEALTAFDAVLTGAPVADNAPPQVMDITDEWFDMTQLPYIKYFVAGWKHRITPEIAATISQVGEKLDTAALKNLQARTDGNLTDNPLHQIPGHYRYRFDEDAIQGLETFYRFAFFHGLTKDIPDITFWKEEIEEESPNS